MNCPICHQPLHKENRSLVCTNHHTFDIARQGYVNLSRKQKASGDNEQMSKARSAFLETGAYDFLADQLVDLMENLQPEVWIDLGCGEGYYTRQMSPFAQHAYGIDLSQTSIRHAAAQDKKTQYIVGSIYDLPFDDDSVDLCTSIFTPIPAKEVLRVLKPGGLFMTVTPAVDHHQELKAVLYDHVRLNDEMKAPEGFEKEESFELREKVHVEDVWTLLEMTPYRYKCSKEALERVKNLKDGLDITFSFVVQVWRKPL